MSGRRKIRNATKRKAVEELKGGERPGVVAERFKITHGMLRRWLHEYDAGKFGAVNGATAKPAKVAATPASKTPERVFDDRVREAIQWLRKAEKEIERMKAAGTLKELDKAHHFACIALRELQGDNAT